MASTLYTSLQYRTVSAEHAAAEFTSLSPLIASGAVTVDPNPPFKGGGGITYNVPSFLEITGADVVPTAASDGTRNAIATFKDVGVVTEREYGLGVEESAKLAIGGEGVGSEITRQVANYWQKRLAIALYSVAKGGFATAMSSSTIFALAPGTKFDPLAMESIVGLTAVGDEWANYRIWLMRSTQFAQLVAGGFVTYMQAGAFGERLLMSGDIPTILGKQIVVDDNIQETDGTTYLCKPGAFYLGFQKDFGVEMQRDASLGGGTDEYWLRAAFMPHMTGLTYGGVAKPTNATLATGASWSLSQTTEYKLNKVVKIKFENS
jgi:hypothetical protein